MKKQRQQVPAEHELSLSLTLCLANVLSLSLARSLFLEIQTAFDGQLTVDQKRPGREEKVLNGMDR